MRVSLSLLGCHNSGCHKAQHSTQKCIMYMLAATARPNRYEIPRRRARQLAGPAAHCMMANNAVPSKAARPICARASRAPLLSTVRTERSALREQVGQSRSAGECTRWAWGGGGRRGSSFVFVGRRGLGSWAADRTINRWFARVWHPLHRFNRVLRRDSIDRGGVIAAAAACR